MKETKQQVSPLSEAVRKLRIELGESQQAFAYRMKTAIRTIARYETIRPPKGHALSEFYRVASETGHDELAAMFRNALTAEMGMAGRFTQLGALASHTIPVMQSDLALLAHNLEYAPGTASTKLKMAIKQIKAVVAKMDALIIYMPKPTEEESDAGETE